MAAESVEDRKLFVANLKENVNDSLLYELFMQAGPVENVMIESAVDHSVVGIITYKHRPSVGYAKDIFRGTQLFGQELTLSSENLLDYAKARVRGARDSMLRHCHMAEPWPRQQRMDSGGYDRRNRNREREHDRGRDRYHPYDRHQDRREPRRHGQNHYGMNNRNRGRQEERQRRYY